MQNGTYVHERLQQHLTKALGTNVEIEREINLVDPPIRGFVDAIVTQGDIQVVGEIKSAKQEIFDNISTSGKPITYHLVQLLIYMKALGLKDGFFYYENKNTQQFIIIPVQMNDSLEAYAEEIFQWMRDVRAAWDEGKLATPITPKRAAKACTYCPVKQACKDRADGDITIPLLAVKE
jgi:CRISPR/Cas system-associated exonuclease Cas4 (RecB family)